MPSLSPRGRTLSAEHQNRLQKLYARVGRVPRHDAGDSEHESRVETRCRAQSAFVAPAPLPFHVYSLEEHETFDQDLMFPIGT